jgi:hypothetical protein
MTLHNYAFIVFIWIVQKFNLEEKNSYRFGYLTGVRSANQKSYIGKFSSRKFFYTNKNTSDDSTQQQTKQIKVENAETKPSNCNFI